MPLMPPNGFYHFGVVVRDCEAAMAAFSRIFGIARWEFQTLHEDMFTDPRVHGEPRRQRFKSGVAVHGNVRFELCEPLADDETVYAEFARERGYGLQHLFFTIVEQKDFAAIDRGLARAGIGYAQNAIISDTVDYYYAETFEMLGGVAEMLVIKGPNPAGGPPRVFDFGPEVTDTPGRPAIDGLYRFGVVCAGDTSATQAAYEQVFGVTDWRECTLSGAGGAARQALVGRNGPVAVELIDARRNPGFAARAHPGGPVLSHIAVAMIEPAREAATIAWAEAQGLPLVEALDAADGGCRVLRFDGAGVLDGVDVEVLVRTGGDPRHALRLANVA